MINNMKPLSLGEVKELLANAEEQKEVSGYLKKFGKLNKEKAISLEEELRQLNNSKIKEDYLVKIVDFLPKDQEGLLKIFNDISLDEKEINEILEIVKKY